MKTLLGVNCLNQIEKVFINKAIVRGGIHLFYTEDALKLIKKCREANIKILGIDSFIVSETTTQPLAEYSIDFSTQNSSTENWREAEKFILDKQTKGFLFEIVHE